MKSKNIKYSISQYLVVILFSLFWNNSKLTAQGIILQWAKSFGSVQNEVAYELEIDQSGNIYTAGSFTGVVDFDPGPSIASYTSNGVGDIFINKLDPNGNFLWTIQIGGSFQDAARAIVIDLTGNIYTTGTFSGTVDFDPGPGIFNLTSAGGVDIFICKIDPLGNFVWAKRIGSTGGDASTDITLDPSGNVFTTGNFNSIVDFDPGPGTFTLNSGGTDFFISKLDANGNFVSAKNISEVGNNATPQNLKLDGFGNVYLSGIFNYTVDFCPGPSVFTLSTSGSILDFDVFIAKYDPSFNFIYAKSFGGLSQYDDARGMAVDPSGNVFTTGYVQTVVDFDTGPGTFLSNTFGMEDIFVHKLDPSGNFVWAKRIGFVNHESGNDICLDAAGNIYTTGSFYSTVDFDPGPGTFTLGAGAFQNTFIHKLDPSGNFVFAKQLLSASGSNYGESLKIDGSGNLFITGIYTSTVDLDPSASTQSFTSSGGWDVYIEKFNSCSFSIAGGINGASSVCSGKSYVYSVTPVLGATGYLWTLPSGWTGISSTNTINVTSGTTSGVLGVAVIDACGIGSPSTLNITTNLSPNLSVNSGTICNGQSFTIVPFGASSYTIQGGNAIVSPTTTSTYSIIGTSSLGCVSNSVSISSITVEPLPNISVNNGSICAGNSYTIIPIGASSYTFLSGSPIVSPSLSTSYSVIGTSSAGCLSNSVTICNVSVNPTPSITANSGTLCSGLAFTITPIGALTYTYSSGSSVVLPVANSSYSISGTNVFGCISPTPAISNVTVVPSPTISVNSGSICSSNTFTLNPTGAITYTFSGGNPIVSPTSNTSYSVTGTNGFGCVSLTSAISNITVHPRPIITVNSGSICASESFTLNPSGANTYTFSSGSSVVSPTTSSTYSIIGTSIFGCVSSMSAIANITVHPNPNLVVTGGSICPGYSFTFNPWGANTYSITGGSLIVTPIQTSTYQVTGVSNHGCISTSTATVVVTNTLLLSIVGNNTVCQGSMLNLKAIGASNYLWSTGQTTESISIAVSTNTVLSVIGANSNCSNTAQHSINASPLPKLTVSSDLESLCVGSSATLIASGAMTYTWNNGTNTPTLLVTPTISTTYSVIGTDLNFCCSLITFSQNVTNCDFLLFPNPTSDYVIITGGKAQTNNKIEVFDTRGRLIMEYDFANKIEINFSEKASGLYLVKVISNDKLSVWKIIKQ